MARVYNLEEAQNQPPGQVRDWLYNTLDVTGTREVADVLLPRIKGSAAGTYGFERALQSPAISMALRGIRVDRPLRDKMVRDLEREMKRDGATIAAMPLVRDKWDGRELNTGFCEANFGKHHKWPRGVSDDDPAKACQLCHTPRWKAQAFNANSGDQVKHLLYDIHGVAKQTNKEGEVSADEDALERVGRKFPEYRGLTDAILEIRDKKKQHGSLSAKLSPSGRYLSVFNVGAAWTGRFSSSKAPFGLGGNLQNVAERHRRVFIADPGMDIGYADYMQGESNLVAHLSGDERYIEAHRLGDVHTYVTRFMFPNLPWTGDLAKDKKIAKTNPPWDQAPGHDYRFQCKRIVHGSNYGLQPLGIIFLYPDIPFKEAKQGWENYMHEFDGIPAWQEWVRGQVRDHKILVNPLGRAIQLVGRPRDPHTWRQALSFLPQSALADIENIALWRVWHELEPKGVEELAQVHDAILHQFPRGDLALERLVLECMRIPVPVTDFRGKTRIMTIGVEAETGRNWGHRCTEADYAAGKCKNLNPDGISSKEIEEYLSEHPLPALV